MKRVFRVLFTGALITLLGFAALGAVAVRGTLTPRVKRIFIEKPEKSLDELVKEVPQRYGHSPILIQAILAQESAGGQLNAIRFEPGQMKRAVKISKDPNQQRMLASSHGPMQIMGWWAPEFHISWANLYDNETNIEIGSAILKKCMDRHAGKRRVSQIHAALICYNGAEEYADAVLRRVADLLIEREL